jgi:hypothetical protein
MVAEPVFVRPTLFTRMSIRWWVWRILDIAAFIDGGFVASSWIAVLFPPAFWIRVVVFWAAWRFRSLAIIRAPDLERTLEIAAPFPQIWDSGLPDCPAPMTRATLSLRSG